MVDYDKFDETQELDQISKLSMQDEDKQAKSDTIGESSKPINDIYDSPTRLKADDIFSRSENDEESTSEMRRVTGRFTVERAQDS